MAEYNITAADLGSKGKAVKVGKAATASSKGAKKIASAKPAGIPKYADPVSGKTWTGHGKPPAWIALGLKKGKSKEDFLIGAVLPAVKPVANKVAKPTKAFKATKGVKAVKETPAKKPKAVKKAPKPTAAKANVAKKPVSKAPAAAKPAAKKSAVKAKAVKAPAAKASEKTSVAKPAATKPATKTPAPAVVAANA